MGRCSFNSRLAIPVALPPGEFDDRRDPPLTRSLVEEVAHGGGAQIPADRPRHLCHQLGHRLGGGGHRTAVGVRQQPDGGLGGDDPLPTAAYPSSAEAMYWVWNAPAVASRRTRARAGGSRQVCPGPTPHLRRRSVLQRSVGRTRSRASSRASTSSSSPPSSADIPVVSTRAGLGHLGATGRRQRYGLVGRDDAGDGVGGDLADRVSGGDNLDRAVDGTEHLAFGEFLVGEQGRGHNKGLGHRGVGDLFRGAGGAQPGKIKATDLRPRSNTLADSGQLEPSASMPGVCEPCPGARNAITVFWGTSLRKH